MAAYKTGSRFGSTQTEVYCYLFIIQETIQIVEIFFYLHRWSGFVYWGS